MSHGPVPAVPACSVERLRADFDRLAEFHDPERPGWTRGAFSPFYAASRDWMASRMSAAGLTVRRDAVDNLIGTLPGARTDAPALVTGSHTDTVEGGGRFDGIIGVLGALEAVRTLADAGIALEHELRVVDFFNEEPNQFGLSCVGSRALVGEVTRKHLDLDDGAGETLRDALARVGGSPDDLPEARWSGDDVAAFLELHIEQGPVLEHEGLPVAVVSAIAGIDRYRVEFTGRPDHAGATPMDYRYDASCAAAETVLAVERLAADEGTGVATTGRIEIEPGAPNVVPGRARLWVEFRSGEREWLDDCGRGLHEAARAAAERRGVQADVHSLSASDPVAADTRIRELLERGNTRLGLPHRTMFSGAGHDAAHMARLAPMGMLFVPSHGGRSHCPEEWTDLEQVATGARALAQGLVEVDRARRRDAAPGEDGTVL
ncbi:Zn-dependent hydrolase [Streptomyces sp. RKND-216]|uniref:M20 family metallo-hydrolase n=1 Tax=Streptomyces sp. RKND-216 TaxID=2562581 RepID=UPI00109DC7C6|nr:M20 family metallo-hydrolase [Streptomyces sp. RKND-216]THA23961.1 Zn-dependent hydrolase [Streptomyces sp. RKND-216]